MVDVIFDLTTNDSWSVDDAICEGKGRWATGKRLTNRLPKLSLITYVPGRIITCHVKPCEKASKRQHAQPKSSKQLVNTSRSFKEMPDPPTDIILVSYMYAFCTIIYFYKNIEKHQL